MSPFAMAPAAIPDDPRAPIAAAPLQVALSGPLSPFALAQVRARARCCYVHVIHACPALGGPVAY